MVKPVLLIRGESNDVDAHALNERGIPTLIDPYLEVSISADPTEGMELFGRLRSAKGPLWVIATSRNAMRFWALIVGEDRLQSEIQVHKNLKFAAIGDASADALHSYGASEVFLPSNSQAQTLAEELVAQYPISHVLLPGGNLAMTNLPDILTSAGWTVLSAAVYTIEKVAIEPASAQGVRTGEFSAVLLRSPSAVDALTHFVPQPQVRLVCAGPTTASAVQAHGLKVDAISPQPTPDAVAEAIHNLIFG